MKRILCFFFVIACFFVVEAKHLEFMGIPINGTITNFQQKLIAKGCTYDAKASKEAPAGIKMYKGVFAGKECKIVVWYNNRTKQVYQVRAIIDAFSKESSRSNYMYYRNLLSRKYSDCAFCVDKNKEALVDISKYIENITNETYEFICFISDYSDENFKFIGSISIEIVDYDTYPNKWGVFIDYEDYQNSNSNDKDVLKDI